MVLLKYESTSWTKKINIMQRLNYQDMHARHMHAQYHGFLIKGIKSNKKENLH